MTKKWWEYLMFWRWIGVWFAKHNEKKRKNASVENDFQKLLNEAEERRGDLTDAVKALRADREKRQAASLAPRVRLNSEATNEGR